MDELAWSDWFRLENFEKADDLQLRGPGVYEIRVVQHGEPVAIPRWLGTDEEGLVYIGHTGHKVRGRLRKFRDGADKHDLSHTAGKKRYILNRWVPSYDEQLGDLVRECRWTPAEKEEAQKIESDLLLSYTRRFGETPPLNGEFPRRKSPDVWREHSAAMDDSTPEPGPEHPITYCADIGLVSKNRFGWARGSSGTIDQTGSDIEELAEAVARDLSAGEPVSLGLECPLYIPVRSEPEAMRKARMGEGNRPWSAAAGLGALTVGLSQSVWLLRAIQDQVGGESRGFIDWDEFVEEDRGLFLWEAFVSGDAKASNSVADPHAEDAAIAVRSFLAFLPDPWTGNAVREDSVHSLIGAALLRTGWSEDLRLLTRPCLVIRSQKGD